MKKELEKNKVIRSKLAIISFILSLVPIVMLILYLPLRDILFNSLVLIIIGYNIIVGYTPYLSIILSITALVSIRKKNLKGIGFAISGLIISLLEIIIFNIILK